LGKVTHHRFRALGTVLTLASAALVSLVLFLPGTASSAVPSGKDGVLHYETNNFGKSRVHNVGHNEDFAIIGKNLNHATQVYCWDVSTNNWIAVDFWLHFNSRVLWYVNANDACTGSTEHGMAVAFDDGGFIEGPRIAIS
jgi:hypothetical protein